MEIAILGAGVAGVSSAIALRQRGFDVTVYERHPSASDMGAGIVLWPNATYVLEQLGVLDEMASVSGRPTRMQRLSITGENLGSIDISMIDRRMAYPSFSILRRDLQAILISKLASLGVKIDYGHAVSRIGTTATGTAEVQFADGMRIRPEVVIGADGRMASTARGYVWGDNRPVYQGFINWIGVFESEEEVFPEIAVNDYWGVGERFGIVPITHSKAYWAGAVAASAIGGNDQADYKGELAAIFAGWPDPVGKMIDKTPVRRMNKLYVHDHEPIPTWHRNNVIAIGDAAHAPLPTSGQGACQALEDAWHLANGLTKEPCDLERVFSRFTALRFEKTAGITHAARRFASSLFSRDPVYCKERNEGSRNTDFSAVAAAMAKGWAAHLPVGR